MTRNSLILSFAVVAMAALILPATPQDQETSTPLVDFVTAPEKEIGRWVTIDDSVFFGASDTHWEITSEGSAQFSGTLSLKRGGGWCTVRRKPEGAIDLSRHNGIHLRILGDGKTYGFDLRHDKKRNGVYYEATFHTTANQWQDINLPFTAFEPLHLGSPEDDAQPLNLHAIRSFAFVIAHRQEGGFRLNIETIDAY